MRKKIRVLYLLSSDIILINLSFFLSLLVRFDFKIPQQYVTIYLNNILVYLIIKLGVFTYFKLYKSLWRYASIGELMQVIASAILSNILLVIYWNLTGNHLPRSIYILVTIFDMVLVGGFRISYRVYRRIINESLSIGNTEKKAMIIGAGEAGAMAKGGEIFVLDMGEPVKILDLAEDIIRLSGLEPYEDIDIEITGLRPGEKLYEELLLSGEGISSTKHEKIFIEEPVFLDYEYILNKLECLKSTLKNRNDYEIKEALAMLVPTYKDAGYVNQSHLKFDNAKNEVAATTSLLSSMQ